MGIFVLLQCLFDVAFIDWPVIRPGRTELANVEIDSVQIAALMQVFLSGLTRGNPCPMVQKFPKRLMAVGPVQICFDDQSMPIFIDDI